MCKVFDEVRAEVLTESVKAIMESFSLTAQEALDALKIPEPARPAILAAL